MASLQSNSAGLGPSSSTREFRRSSICAVPLSHGEHGPTVFCPAFVIDCVQNCQDFSTARRLSPTNALSPLLPLLFLTLPHYFVSCVLRVLCNFLVFLVCLNRCVLPLFSVLVMLLYGCPLPSFQHECFRSITFSRSMLTFSFPPFCANWRRAKTKR